MASTLAGHTQLLRPFAVGMPLNAKLDFQPFQDLDPVGGLLNGFYGYIA